jgi:hypothetical protein
VTALGAYMSQLWQRQVALSGKIGAWLPGMNTDSRVVLACSDASQVVLIKLLVDKGLITDAELVAAFNAATVADFTAVAPQPEPGPSP